MNFFKQLFGGDGLSAQDVQTQLSGNQPPMLIDVRQPDEYKAGHIRGAKLIPLDQLSAKANTLPKNRTIICVCRSGARSGSATRQLRAVGLDAVNMNGGMMGWQRAGLPVEKGNAKS